MLRFYGMNDDNPTTQSTADLSRRRIAACALRTGGVLVWIAAGVHFFALPLLRASVAPSPSGGYNFTWPILAFVFSLDGVLLLPLGLLRSRNFHR